MAWLNLRATRRVVPDNRPPPGNRRPGVSVAKGRPAMNAGAYSALDASVLVLNKTFMAVHIISVRRAFCLLCKDLAEVVHLDDGQFATYDFQSWSELSAYRASHFRKE